MSYYAKKARERRDRLRLECKCIWCTVPLTEENRTLAARFYKGTRKLTDRCDRCRKKERDHRKKIRTVETSVC